jgi:uncharacterized damage-inducible protein DinB
MSVRELLVETVAHIPPASALDGLAPAEAERRVPGASHSIAEIVAHVTFWATWFCDRCDGTGAPMVTSAAHGWPAVAPGSWPDLRREFLDTLERAVAIGADEARLAALLAPKIDFPPLAHYSVRDALVHISNHNAHHLGQVIVLRQIMGLWPPPSGSWTW